MATYATSETTKGLLINAAGELAAEQGFSNVSTRAVAVRSGENIGSIHYHFGGKDGLFEAVVAEAMHGCRDVEVLSSFLESEKAPSREAISQILRQVIAAEISDLFRSNRPDWHSQVIYQLLQRDDDLYEMLRKELLDPSLDALAKLFLLINPSFTSEELFLHSIVIKMPVFSHANNMKAIQKRLGVDYYSEDYLQKLEDVLVKQTQLLLGLPLD